MKAAKFTLDHLFYPEISVKASKSYDPSSTEKISEPEVQVFVNKTGQCNFHVGVSINLSAEAPSDPYEIEALAVGVFTCDETMVESEQMVHIARSGPNLVFGGLRDMVATITSRGPWSEHYLQPYIFEPDDFVQKNIAD
ncbi:protein-export chaperone SecB [Pseudomonas brassicacearum]|uniref:protein-export chaperone SecB n=1 Tax=Pseudomonas TaxID=286 RepID=UPI0005B4A54E|nr:protein-export chaperone SecB [Pseudomonas brassicacearum]